MMDWGIISQATFFLSIALLATVITIFVFASSLLGQAAEVSAIKQKKLLAEQKEEKDRQIKQAKEQLDDLLRTSGTEELKIEQAKKSLDDLKKQTAKFDNKLRNIQRDYSIFKVEGGVAYPGLSFLISIMLNGLAWSLARSEPVIWGGYLLAPVTQILWGVALAAMGYGCYRVYFSLKKIQEVAVASEAEKKPELELRPYRFPSPIKRGEWDYLVFFIKFRRGSVAKNCVLSFYDASGQFEFSEDDSWPKGTQVITDSLITIEFRWGTILEGLDYGGMARLKAPSKKGSFTLSYELACEGFYKREKFTVEVE